DGYCPAAILAIVYDYSRISTSMKGQSLAFLWMIKRKACGFSCRETKNLSFSLQKVSIKQIVNY
ncbi:hypothetical protein, partial [[Ruminococcus] torques]|uniref:hypothetical protein n=1 Tax=[Ruminococcus] torques TaxID=33039 RepID=UPI001EDF4ECC